jgi:hypothetical protein
MPPVRYTLKQWMFVYDICMKSGSTVFSWRQGIIVLSKQSTSAWYMCSPVNLNFMLLKVLNVTAWSDILLLCVKVFHAAISRVSIISLWDMRFYYLESHIGLWNSTLIWFYNSFSKVLHLWDLNILMSPSSTLRFLLNILCHQMVRQWVSEWGSAYKVSRTECYCLMCMSYIFIYYKKPLNVAHGLHDFILSCVQF